MFWAPPWPTLLSWEPPSLEAALGTVALQAWGGLCLVSGSSLALKPPEQEILGRVVYSLRVPNIV